MILLLWYKYMIRGRVFLEGFFKVLISNQILIYLFVLDEDFQL